MSEKSETPSKQQKTTVDKDVRLRILKEKQNEERQRKLEEIRAQAFAAQRFKEQKEQERRQRLEEMRIKEEIRRQQVEERKKAINDAERDRLESILRRNQQRENSNLCSSRLESKRRNERSSLVFAFGSSTPRNLDPNDLTSSFWGHRRATSTQNITTCTSNSFTRRGTDRDMENGSKKRATSAGGLERAGDTSSRPSSSMSHQSTTSVTSSVSVRHRPSSGPRKPRPASIAITGVSANQDKKLETTKPPLPKRRSITKSTDKVSKSRPSTGENTPKPLVSPTNTDLVSVIERKVNGDVGEAHKKPPDAVEILEAQQAVKAHGEDKAAQEVETEDLLNLVSQPVLQNGSSAQQPEIDIKTSIPVENRTEIDSPSELCQPTENSVNKSENLPQLDDTKVTDNRALTEEAIENLEASLTTSILGNSESIISQTKELTLSVNNDVNKEMSTSLINSEMTASQIKAKISTEEEAKAAIAERRRLAKEEAARRAEQERLRIEAEQKAELERQRQEEEQVRLLIEAQRAAEEQRLNEAILEAKKKEEEEQQRREEEARMKALKEEADKKARLEAEKQKAEQQERLMKEEKEREARRKRVEAIMLRTRGKQNANQQNSEDSCENKSENKMNGTKPIDEQNGPNIVKEERVDNIIQEDPVKNANSVSIETINSSTDSMNSNNLWQAATQQYGNFVLNNNS